jgi:hypothetical protein
MDIFSQEQRIVSLRIDTRIQYMYQNTIILLQPGMALIDVHINLILDKKKLILPRHRKARVQKS